MNPRSRWSTGIILSFILFAACILTFVFIAVTSRVDLVTDNYYEKELKYQDHIEKEKNSAALPKNVECIAEPGIVRLHFPAIDPSLTGSIDFFRPSDKSQDFSVRIALDSNYTQSVSTYGRSKGLWRIRISWTATGKDYFFEQPMTL